MHVLLSLALLARSSIAAQRCWTEFVVALTHNPRSRLVEGAAVLDRGRRGCPGSSDFSVVGGELGIFNLCNGRHPREALAVKRT